MATDIAALAKSYARQLERGQSPAGAEAYIRREFPVTDEQVAEAIRQVGAGLRVSEVLATLQPWQPLWAALEGQEPIAATVGVRVKVRLVGRKTRNRSGQLVDQWRTVYLDMSWLQTVNDVREEAKKWAKQEAEKYGDVDDVEIVFSGPTLWPLT